MANSAYDVLGASRKKFLSWQFRTILVSMVGYAIYYFVRKNFSLAMPGLTAQYGISNTDFGIVIGIGSLVYGFSRFCCRSMQCARGDGDRPVAMCPV